MLPKANRLTRRSVEYVFKKGDRIENKFFSVRFTESTALKSRFCVVVSSKIAPKAVKRNLLRRQIYEAIREAQKMVNNERSFNIVLIVKKNIDSLNFLQLKNVTRQILIQLYEQKKPL